MKREVVLRDPKKLRFDKNQPRKSFKLEDVKLIAETYKVHGIINNPEIDGDNNIITGELRVRAAIYSKLSEIECTLITGLSKVEIKERQVIENVHRHQLTSKEREDAVSDLWESGDYKYQKDLGNILGLTRQYISQLLKAKSTREGLSSNKSNLFSTKTIHELGRIKNPIERKQVAKKIIDPNSSIPSKTVRKFIGTLKDLSKTAPELKKELLKPETKITEEKLEKIQEIAKLPPKLRDFISRPKYKASVEEIKELGKLPEDVQKGVLKENISIEDAKSIAEISKPELREEAIKVIKQQTATKKYVIKKAEDLSDGKIKPKVVEIDLDKKIIEQFGQVYKQVIMKMTARLVNSYSKSTKEQLIEAMSRIMNHLQKELIELNVIKKELPYKIIDV